MKTGAREEGDRGQGDGGGEQGRKREENGGWGEVEKGGVVTQWRSKSNSAASKRTEAIGQEVFQHMSAHCGIAGALPGDFSSMVAAFLVAQRLQLTV